MFEVFIKINVIIINVLVKFNKLRKKYLSCVLNILFKFYFKYCLKFSTFYIFKK